MKIVLEIDESTDGGNHSEHPSGHLLIPVTRAETSRVILTAP